MITFVFCTTIVIVSLQTLDEDDAMAYILSVW